MPEVLSVRLAMGSLELEIPEGVHEPGPSSRELADYIAICPGQSLLDLGCGTGLLALAAARRGIPEVWATDIDFRAVQSARRNAERNRLKIHSLQGDLFEPVHGLRFDIIATNPPQTPAPEEACGPKFGGPDGLRTFEPLLREAPGFLHETGKLLTMLVSLADTRRFLSLLSRSFHHSQLRQTPRRFTREEYDACWPGLFAFLESRRSRGLAEFEKDGDEYLFWTRFYMAWLK